MRKVAKGTVALGTLVGLVSAMGAACGGAPPEPKDPAAAAASVPLAPSCVRARPGVGAVRADELRQGGAVTLARLGTTTLAYVADEDSQVLHTIDVMAGREIATTSLGGSPAQAMVLADGRVVVTLRDKNAIEVLEPGESANQPLASRCTLKMPAEPHGLAATPDDKTVLVSAGWAHALVGLEAATLAKKFQVNLPREPRAVVVDDAGERAFVSHVVGGKMSVVDLTTSAHDVREIDLGAKGQAGFGSGRSAALDRLRTGTQGFALAKVSPVDKAPPPPPSGEKPLQTPVAPVAKPGTITKQPAKPKPRVVVPMTTVDPGDPGVRSTAYYGDMVQGVARIAPMVAVVDPSAERSLTKSVLSLGDRPSRQCVLPRAAAVRPSKGTMLVACLGIDAVVELDTRGLDPSRLELRRFAVPAGPTGVAIDDASGVAVVWSQFDPGVTIVKLDDSAPAPVSVAVRYSPSASVKQLAVGRKIFHHTDDPRIASDGVACASCHPDGREDSLTWATPDGPRQTIMLAGRQTASAPYGWTGKHDNLPDYVADTFSRLGGTGVKGDDLDQLLTYVQGVAGPPPVAPEPGSDHAVLAQRGKQIFDDPAQGCATCHLGGRGVDKTLHDVGSTASADNFAKYDTPSLRFISGTAPYFHDGRYEKLEDMLKASDHRMGRVLQLSQKDVSALEAYLQTL
jgi:DNA-binding beta-propeller fold protein YncE